MGGQIDLKHWMVSYSILMEPDGMEAIGRHDQEGITARDWL